MHASQLDELDLVRVPPGFLPNDDDVHALFVTVLTICLCPAATMASEELKKEFEQYAEAAKQLPKKPDQDTVGRSCAVIVQESHAASFFRYTQLLQLYGLYNQATVGDVNTPQPWAVQFEARAKWDGEYGVVLYRLFVLCTTV